MRNKILAGLGALAVGVALTVGGVANAAPAAKTVATVKPATVKAATDPISANGGIQSNGTIVACVNVVVGSATRNVWYAPGNGVSCPTGYVTDHFNITGRAGPTGATGPAGPAGAAGADATLTVSAATSLANRVDSGGHGNWATDTLSRTALITRDHKVAASKCGATAAACWFYTGRVNDAGTFLTITGAQSPGAGTVIPGQHVAGAIAGYSTFEIFASSDTPDASLVPATTTGNGQSTSDWMKLFFPAGTLFAGMTQPTWSWTYTTQTTCEKWVNALAGNTGDIAGVNAC